MSNLLIGGFDTLSTIDYPDMLAAVVYLQGCAWRCGYCHNKHLQPRVNKNNLEWDKVFEFIERRKEKLDGVVFSGGEPLLQSIALRDAIEQVLPTGLYVGMHTAGYNLADFLLVAPKCHWIGLDIKAPLHKYREITGSKSSGVSAWECVEALVECAFEFGVDYQIRITHDKTILTDYDIISMRKDLISLGINDKLITIQNCNKGIVK